jgi:hypothetical protein
MTNRVCKHRKHLVLDAYSSRRASAKFTSLEDGDTVEWRILIGSRGGGGIVVDGPVNLVAVVICWALRVLKFS